MEPLNQNLITTLDQSLRQTRSTQSRLVARLREIDAEAESLRQEVQALENIANQTEEAIYSLVGSSARVNIGQQPSNSKGPKSGTDDGGDNGNGGGNRNSYDNRHQFRPYTPPPKPQNNGYQGGGSVSYMHNAGNNGNNNGQNSNNGGYRNPSSMRFENEPSSQRFSDRTITQACTLILREAGRPMHVNELFGILQDGGFEFKGNNPTISIAVSLNRNRRFDKVAPGTFDLVLRDASSQAAS
jgi:hypothetical protein